jgi:glycosyltransferase involved in cell wall biosynthesis
MKLLFILSEYLPDSGGGIITYYAGVLPHLVKAGHEVDVLVAANDKLDEAPLEVEGVRVSYLRSASLREFEGKFDRFRLEFPSFHAFLPMAWAAYEQTKGGAGYDLVETTDFPMLYAPWVVAPRGPVNVSLHGSPGQIDWEEAPRRHSLDMDFHRTIELAAIGAAPGLQANSEANARFWSERTRREVPVLLPAYEPQAWQPMSALQQGGIVVGRLQRWKGPEVLCEALAGLPDTTVRWIGRVVTDPETGESYAETLTQRFPKVFGKRLIPITPMPNAEVRRAIAAADFLCVPSTWDVFNLTAVEAMELGTPVICSKKAGASMLIEHGVNGFLFDPADPSSLAGAIQACQAMQSSERVALVKAARQTIEKRLAPENLAEQRIHYYQQQMTKSLQTDAPDWLHAALSPRDEGKSRTQLLGAFTIAELVTGPLRHLKLAAGRWMGGAR